MDPRRSDAAAPPRTIDHGGSRRPRVLLSSVCQPFGEEYGDGFGASYEGSHQIMWAQGIFRTRGVTTQWGIDFIAANLRAPTVTLHYPTMDQFIAEIQQGYDYVGIAFVAATKHKMVPMVRAIRRYAPAAKIVLGGYGTTLDTGELEQYADHVCRGEGVQFMRELLGEPTNVPIVQPDIVQQQSLFSVPLLGKVGYVFAGLGCPNGCDFCVTSHYFKRKHVRFLPDGPSILRAIQDMRAKHPGMVDFWISDEDFLLNRARGRGFLDAVRASNLPPLALSVFSSVKALSQFSAAELVEMGIDWVWVGFEAKRAGYAKMNGKPFDELFAELQSHGIAVMASMIIGFDYQTPEIIEEEFEELMSLRPTMSQFLIYGPARGTPVYERMEAAGRLTPGVSQQSSKHDGFSLVFDHPHIDAPQMEAIQRRLYRQEFERLGPSVFRVAEVRLQGHLNLREHAAPRVRAKAWKYREEARPVVWVLPASKRYVNARVGAWMDDLGERVIAASGPLSRRERVFARLAPAMLWQTDFKMRHGIGQQPRMTRKTFRVPGRHSERVPVLSLWPSIARIAR